MEVQQHEKSGQVTGVLIERGNGVKEKTRCKESPRMDGIETEEELL